ncbi:hypothetical protein NQ314_009397 [Rhamnusium bicolor]|uniref:HTH psq-type domain-containing protein n=1 Tax=Rhamnusium bicolor TaxID=1586634 RepID=A0AAV8Y158_9CUCU|nr:hypothetical protein NQ314_009397 [Rhamnusium bicolor]
MVIISGLTCCASVTKLLKSLVFSHYSKDFLVEATETMEEGHKTHQRKRKRNVSKWQVNEKKSLRNSGKAYIGHKKKPYPPRELQPYQHSSTPVEGRTKIKILPNFSCTWSKATKIDEIHHKFLESGHTFMECDQDFGIIEKAEKKDSSGLCSRTLEIKNLAMTKIKKEKSKKTKGIKRKFFCYDSDQIKNDLEAIQNSMATAIAAKHFDVPRSTLRDKIAGETSEAVGKVGLDSVLGKIIENKLCQWVKNMSEMGFPVNKDGHCFS